MLHGDVEGYVERRPTVGILVVELRKADLFRRWILQYGGEILEDGEGREILSSGRGW